LKRRPVQINDDSSFSVAFPFNGGNVAPMQNPCARAEMYARLVAGQSRILTSVRPLVIVQPKRGGKQTLKNLRQQPKITVTNLSQFKSL
jgi:hypothetical protein